MKKRLLSLVLVLAMLASLVGCGSGKTITVNGEKLEPVTLKMYFHGSNVTDDSKVLEKLNAYLQEKINVTLEPIWGTWGDFDTNAVLALQGGEPIDIYFTCSWSADEYNKFAREGYWVRLDDPQNNLIEKYAKDLWKTLPSVLTQGATIQGKSGYGVYAVPGYKDIATQNTWDINVTLLKKYGYTVEDVKKAGYYGLGEILAKVKAGEGKDFYPLLVEAAVLERMVTNSIIVTGDSGSGNFMSYYLDPTDVIESYNGFGELAENYRDDASFYGESADSLEKGSDKLAGLIRNITGIVGTIAEAQGILNGAIHDSNGHIQDAAKSVVLITENAAVMAESIESLNVTMGSFNV